MPATLFPSRYFLVLRYVLQRLVQGQTLARQWRGKARALASAHMTNSTLATSSDKPGFDSEFGSLVRDYVVDEDGAGPSAPRRDPAPQRDPASPPPPLKPDPRLPPEPQEIYRLMNDQRLLEPGAVKPPKEVIVLAHGLYGFSTSTPIPLFPSLKLHYWASVLDVLRERIGAKVVVIGVNGTGSVRERAEQMHAQLSSVLPKGAAVNLVAHSMGGLDCRYLISRIKPKSYTPISLTTIGTPHRGSPFMDWCAANIGVGTATAVATAALTAESAKESVKRVAQALPYSLKAPLLGRAASEGVEKKDGSGLSGFTSGLTSYLLNIFDSPAYANLTTSFVREDFNPQTPDDPNVKYMSVAGRIAKVSVLHPLWFPKVVLDAAGENGYTADADPQNTDADGKRVYEGNDGLVSVSSAKWGEFIGAVDGCHHWELRGEGGLLPNGASLGDSISEQERRWKWGLGGELSEHLGLAAAASSAAPSGKPTEDRIKQAAAAVEEAKSKESSNSWDIAQVGQVLDWVMDLMPGGKGAETGKKQLEDAQREKRKEEETNKEGGKKGKGKFDLARFYGGLMIKLREDGF